MIFVRFWGTH